MMKLTKKKKDILVAATKLFCRKGYDGTSIRDISAEIGINQAMLYYYFSDKQEILFYSMFSNLQIIISKVRKIAQLNIPPESKLERLIKAHAMRYDNEKEGFASQIVHSELRHLNENNYQKFMEARDEYENIFREVIKEGIQAGVFLDKDYKLMTIFILTILNSIPRWYKSDGKYSLTEITDYIRNFVDAGIIKT